MRDDVSKAVYFTDTSHGKSVPEFVFDDPTVPDRYALDINAVKLAKLFGWTLEYSRRVASDPFMAAVCYGTLEGMDKAAAENRKKG